MVDTHRLLDCEPVRRLLEDSDQEVTFVAATISSRVYEDVVVSGYSAKAPTEFVTVPVRVKTYQGTAFLHVPKPSGGLLERGLGTLEKEPAQPSGMAAVSQPDLGSVGNSVSGKVGGNVAQYRDYYQRSGGGDDR